MMTNEKILEQYAELSDLKALEAGQSKYVSELRAEQAKIKGVMELSYSWRSGKGYEAFSEELEQYFQDFASKIDALQALIGEIQSAIHDIERRIQRAMRELMNNVST
ncbi:chromosome segregation ATPase [Peribacillus deserti]|uniref:Chromosome segregation ATPase n=1 Tax=Peribacillus deserti TaxID=673318 RepID=A0ABS2QDP6_9BACI|nr:hypothetical protein [Peribacillus deserti]MBM7690799.1 chromosome segregation ATPase [Peribacillus deserti]